MVVEVTKKLCSLIRMAILPDTLHSLSVQQLQSLGSWPKNESITPWLPYCLRSIRYFLYLNVYTFIRIFN